MLLCGNIDISICKNTTKIIWGEITFKAMYNRDLTKYIQRE